MSLPIACSLRRISDTPQLQALARHIIIPGDEVFTIDPIEFIKRSSGLIAAGSIFLPVGK